MLLMTWFDDPYRGTRDLDLLGFGNPDPDAMLTTFRSILAQDAGDGVYFNVESLRVDRIREEFEYGGLRLRTTAEISGARINVVIDIGFGDSVQPGAELVDYPSMLDLPALRLRAYARETVIAEKFQAMVALGRANSRMKDFYDIWILSRSFAFDDDRLPRAIAATLRQGKRRSRMNYQTHCHRHSQVTPKSNSNGALSSRTSPSIPANSPPLLKILRHF